MRIRAKTSFIIKLTLAIFFWFLGFYLFHYQLKNVFSEYEVQKIETTYQNQQKELNNCTQKIVHSLDSTTTHQKAFYLAEKETKGQPSDVFIFKQDSLLAWTTNQIPIPVYGLIGIENGVNELKNGWYYCVTESYQGYQCLGTFLIRSNYPYQNDDLKNSYASNFKLAKNTSFSQMDGMYSVKGLKNEVDFYLTPENTFLSNEWIEFLIFSFYLCAILLFLHLIVRVLKDSISMRGYVIISVPLILFALRYLSIKNYWFSPFESFKIFSPELFASSEYIPSFGDLIINVALYYFIIDFVIDKSKVWLKSQQKSIKSTLVLFPLFIFTFILAFQLNDLIYSLVYDSKINFSLEYLFDLNFYSLISILIIGLCFYAYFRFTQFVLHQIHISKWPQNRLAFIWMLVSSAYLVLDAIHFNHNLLTALWPVLLSGFIFWFDIKGYRYKFVHVISLLAFISFYAAYILDDYVGIKEKEVRKILAEDMATDENPVTEIDFDQIEKNLNDSKDIIPYLLENKPIDGFSDVIEDSHFSSLKSAYEVKSILFDSLKNPLNSYNSFGDKNLSHYQQIISQSGKPSAFNSHIFYIKDYTDKLSYLVSMPVVKMDTIGYLVVELRTKKFPQSIGLPSLLVDKEEQNGNELKHYSMARYVDGRLVYKHGSYTYPYVTAAWFNTPFEYILKNGYSHYVYQFDSDDYTIISKQKTTTLVFLTSFSYLFLVFGIALLFPLGYQKLSRLHQKRAISFNVRLQVVFVGVIIVSLIFFGWGTGTYVMNQYNKNTEHLIKEKSSSVKMELTQKLSNTGQLTSNLVELESLLKKFANVFVTDINLYDLEGNLMASSQPKIYTQGLISVKMNDKAYQKMRFEQLSEFIHDEEIGEMSYLSAYLPFVNAQGNELAYLNVQYISKQDDLEEQISEFMLAIVNIFVLMLLGSVIIAVFLSNQLTAPLKSIQQGLNKMQLGAKNTAIKYKGTDEIGELVDAYNRKVEELQESARQLAKSERESAWREMAKQVAHEIKNPLTPMKLSIQHLQRSVEAKDEDSKQKLSRISASLIEQIDTLAKIANEFSNFAKMPKPQEAEVNLNEVVESVYQTFLNTENIDLKWVNTPVKSMYVWADKTLLLRVLNNLVKNAIQAIPHLQNGEVIIEVKPDKDTHFIISVTDNGSGISKDLADKLFVPYFTTKSTGTGLGLAMSKQIIESMKGDIWFESTEGKGTTFFVKIPAYKNNIKDKI